MPPTKYALHSYSYCKEQRASVIVSSNIIFFYLCHMPPLSEYLLVKKLLASDRIVATKTMANDLPIRQQVRPVTVLRKLVNHIC